MKTKVHRVVLLVVDYDGDMGADDVRAIIEHQKYPNYCISPSVMQIETAEVDWDDDHPLNKRDTKAQAFKELFPK